MKVMCTSGCVFILLLAVSAGEGSSFSEALQDANKLYSDGKREEARDAYRELIDRYPGEPELHRAYGKLSTICYVLKRWDEGVEASSKVFELAPKTFAAQGILSTVAFNLGKCYEGLQDYDQCQEALLKCALYYPWCWSSARAIEHLKLINTYTERYAQSELVAKLYFHICKPDAKTMKEAVDFLTRTLEAVDGNRDRVEQFLLFQKYGSAGPDREVGTEDDVRNILEDIGVPEDPDREAALEVSRQYYQWDYPYYGQHRRKGYLFLLSGQPKEALVAFQKEYNMCPADKPKALEDATDDILRALKTITGNLQSGQRFLEFQKYGAAGADGQRGTEDDLIDVVEEVLESVEWF